MLRRSGTGWRGILARKIALMVVGLAGLTSCAATAQDGLSKAVRNFPALIVGSNTRPTDGRPPFATACPTGGRVVQQGGVVTDYLGADPASPALCRMRIGGKAVEGWYGIWLTDWPGADQAAVAMDRLIHGRTGDVEAFNVRLSPSFSFHDLLRNEGVETITLLGKSYQALKISHYREGAEGNIYRSVVTGWKDMDSGMMLYVTYQHIAGSPELYTPLLPIEIAPGT